MSNSHWYHFFFHDDFGVIRSNINFFSGGKVCLVVASGGHVPLLPPPPPPLGPALNRCIDVKGRFLLLQVYRNFANLFSKLSVSTFYKEMSKFQQNVQR